MVLLFLDSVSGLPPISELRTETIILPSKLQKSELSTFDISKIEEEIEILYYFRLNWAHFTEIHRQIAAPRKAEFPLEFFQKLEAHDCYEENVFFHLLGWIPKYISI